MPYSIGIEPPVAEELRRVVRKQLRLALTELSAAAAPSDGTVHDARRHIKKARAALRLCREWEQWAQRHRAVALGHAVYDEPSSASIDRAAPAWRPAARGQRGATIGVSVATHCNASP